MTETILLILIVVALVFLIYQNLKKNEAKSISENEASKLATINSGIDDLKNRTKNIESLSGSSMSNRIMQSTLSFLS